MTNNPSSFRDPSGFVFIEEGILYRQVNKSYKENYDHLMESGLYDKLVKEGLMIAHKEVGYTGRETSEAYKLIQPVKVDFISYPYEWCFSQLKDAALTTLEIQKTALGYGMSLKDASAYNIQFLKGKPVLIDTLSFELYREGHPWVGYKQFCQHYLAPLALMKYKDVRLNQLLRIYLDGIPLDLTSPLLPARTSIQHSILMHIHLHSKSQKYFSNKTGKNKVKGKMGLKSLQGLVDSLESAIKKMKPAVKSSFWAEYYESEINYEKSSLEEKKDIVKRFLEKANPTNVWDLGANVGVYSRIASDKGIPTIAFDIDHGCVEASYLRLKEKNENSILPLLIDLTNPSPSIGWSNMERMSLLERGPADTVMALALIHHLAIANNIPLDMLASFFQSICDKLIIEFVPKEDSNAQRLLTSREDVFSKYDIVNFERDFRKYFSIIDKRKIKDSERTLYLMMKE